MEEEALVVVVVAPFSLSSFPPVSLASPGATLDVPAASELAFPSLYFSTGSGTAGASDSWPGWDSTRWRFIPFTIILPGF